MVILTPVISLVTAAVLTAHVQAVQVILGNDESGTSPFNDGFDDFVESLLKQWHVPGIAIAVVHEDQTWAKVILVLTPWFGFASLIAITCMRLFISQMSFVFNFTCRHTHTYTYTHIHIQTPTPISVEERDCWTGQEAPCEFLNSSNVPN